ncbi:helix-turn-helix domain-containing protein [Sporanaerobacter acetigenes]|uniref:helix-turn-helix domain-containing protein n=1 Tax=Sporanaerobacter acetigenes TaxID=165813 RepID=UPI0033338862
MKIQELFDLGKNFSDLEIVSGNEYLNNSIKNIRIMDIPYENSQFKKGDFVIVSPDIIVKEKINLVTILNVLKEQKIGLLGFVSNNSISDEIIKHFQQIIKLYEVNFPVIKIPANNTYEDIISTLKYTKDINSFLVNQFKNNLISLKNTNYFSTNNILNILTHYINGLVLLLSTNGEIIDFADANPLDEEKKILTDTMSTLIKDNESNTLSTLNPIVYNGSDEIYTIYPLETYDRDLGYLCIVEEIDKISDSEYNIKISNEAIPFIIISLMTYHEKELIYNKSKEEFVRGILYGLYSDKNIVEKEAKFFNIEYNLKRFVWIINIRPLKIRHSDPLESEKIPANIINETLNIAKASFYDDHAITNTSSIVFIRIKHDIPNEKLLQKYNTLLNTLEFQMPEYKFSIGLSRAYDTLDDLNLAYEDVIFSLKIGAKIFKNGKSIYAYDDLIIYHLLYKYPSNPILERLYNNGIGKIYAYDRENNTQLFETVQVLIKHNCNFSETSDKLFIHRNTLYQRLKKVEEITGLDMDSSETRLVFHLGLKIHDLLSLNLK